MSSSMGKMMKAMTRSYTGLCKSHLNMDLSSTERNVKSRRTVYDVNGAHPDPKKVDAIHEMPPPENQSQLQQFLGMVMYLSPFIPSLSTHTSSLGELLKKDSRVHVEHSLPGSLQPDQVVSLQGHHTPVLQHMETCHCPS